MNFLRVTTGVLALSLMAGAAMAQQDPVAEPAPGEPAVEAAPDNKQASAIRKFLMLQVPVASMPDGRLQQRLERARTYLGSEGLAPDQKQGLENEVAEIEAELARRAEAKAQPEPQPEAQPEPPPVVEAQPEPPPQPETQPEPPPVVEAQPEPPPVVEEAAPATKPEAKPEPETVVKAKPVVDSPEEAEARAMLARQGDARKLSDDQLRRRLDTMRALLASRKLSKLTQRELRQALAQERKELRRRMRNEEASAPDAIMPEPNFEPDQGSEPEPPPMRELRDRRAPEDLSEAELRRRIMLRRAAERDERYSMDEREAWREEIARDRQYLNRRMIEDRRRRESELRIGADSGDYDFELNLDFVPGRAPREDIFAAEADDEEIEEVLIAPPRRAVERRYSLDEIEEEPDLREAVARIEIDTVNFGFGEGFLREEEIDNLDRIARVMERILAANPGEVFMIEGHTDAVGSAQSNLVLSRQRAEAVKRALVRYYVIPPENLRTVGLGERFLKIPTEEPEAENRRVSAARITPLVGELRD
jgi:outer membrane protein OmpA-like peptidoglycan-associated protein